MTAFHTLFHPGNLGLPVPSTFPSADAPPLAAEPILVYGAGGIAGQYAVQLLNIAGYKNVIVTASPKHHEYLKSLGATHAFDYNSPSLAEDIAKVVGGDGKIKLVLDAVTTETTLQAISKIASPQAKIAILLPVKEGSNVTGDERMHMSIPDSFNPFAKSVTVVGVRTFLYQEVGIVVLDEHSRLSVNAESMAEGKCNAKGPPLSAQRRVDQTQSRSIDGPRIIQGPRSYWAGLTQGQQSQRRESRGQSKHLEISDKEGRKEGSVFTAQGMQYGFKLQFQKYHSFQTILPILPI